MAPTVNLNIPLETRQGFQPFRAFYFLRVKNDQKRKKKGDGDNEIERITRGGQMTRRAVISIYERTDCGCGMSRIGSGDVYDEGIQTHRVPHVLQW